ncbi:MAG: HAD-IA family hydrolase [Pleomorphochaeta sp.]
MIDLYIFDMGGVLIRDFHIGKELSAYLGQDTDVIHNYDKEASKALFLHSEGKISEEEFWKEFNKTTKIEIPKSEESLLGKFFHPVLDDATVKVIEDLKKQGKRVVCGTNVIDAHYNKHMQLKQYDVFDKVYASNKMHIAKPKVEFFEEICKSENVKLENAFFTDDSQVNIDAALSCGVKAFLYTDANLLKKQLESLN